VVRHAYFSLEFYRRRFDAIGFDPADDFSFADYARLPVLERSELQAAGASLQIPGRQQVRKDSTGGSTGRPTVIWTGPEERGWREGGTEYFMRRIGLERGRRVALLWGHHLDPVASDAVRDRVRSALSGVRWYDCLRLSPSRIAEFHSDMARWQPTGIVAYATALATFAAELEHRGIRPTYPLRALVTGAEKLIASHREIVERVFDLPVHERYGSRDVGLIGFQEEPDRHHEFSVDWANVLIEPELEGQEAEILVTKLHADAMPMLRYRVEDRGAFPAGSMPGHPTDRLLAVTGRSTDRIWLRGGKWVHGIAFPHLFKDYPIVDFRIHQKADYTVDVTLVTDIDYSTEHAEAIMNVLRSNLVGLPLRIEYTDEIVRAPAYKWRPVITEVAES
jgi:phenylacetate-CoA ligase